MGYNDHREIGALRDKFSTEDADKKIKGWYNLGYVTTAQYNLVMAAIKDDDTRVRIETCGIRWELTIDISLVVDLSGEKEKLPVIEKPLEEDAPSGFILGIKKKS